MNREEFVRRYGGIYELSPWVAEACFDSGKMLPANQLAPLFEACVDSASDEQKLALIRGHPDLAGKAAVAGDLTPESTGEQASAGIDQCTAEEFAKFQTFNDAYRRKFGFPFVMAVRDSNRHAILAAFEARLENDAQTEFETAIREIHKIAQLRLDNL